MNRLTIGAMLLYCTLSLPALAQGPPTGTRFHLQLVSADTGLGTVTRDSRLLTGKPLSMVSVTCVRPDPGKWKRESRECGPRVQRSAHRLLADTTVTADPQGHASERLTWSGGDAVVELDASDRTVVGSGEQMRLKIGFWPRLAHGADAPPGAALRLTYATASYGQLVSMTVYFKDGAQILLVQLER